MTKLKLVKFTSPTCYFVSYYSGIKLEIKKKEDTWEIPIEFKIKQYTYESDMSPLTNILN